MIDIEVLGSGSKGNCYKVTNGDTALLLECGLPLKEIQHKLNFKLSEISGCLVTHEHGDHAKAIKGLVKQGVNCYLTAGTASALGVSSSHRVFQLKNMQSGYESFNIGTFKIAAFKTHHDAAEPIGFLIVDLISKQRLLFVTDSAYIQYTFKPIDIMMIECNYVQSVLDNNTRAGLINVDLRNRIVFNHMGLETLLQFLEHHDKQKLQQIYIMHLSDNNSDEEIIKTAVQRATGVPVYVC